MATTLEEKIAKAEATAKAKAEKEGLDEAATKALVDEAVQKVKEAAEKAAAKPIHLVATVTSNPTYCGIGAGGVQFANGKAVGISERMAAWFREHEGYEVTEE